MVEEEVHAIEDICECVCVSVDLEWVVEDTQS